MKTHIKKLKISKKQRYQKTQDTKKNKISKTTDVKNKPKDVTQAKDLTKHTRYQSTEGINFKKCQQKDKTAKIKILKETRYQTFKMSRHSI